MNENLIFQLMAGTVSLLFGGLMKLFWDRLRRIESEVRDLQADTKTMRSNYVQRFEGLSEQVAEFRVEIVQKIGNIETLIASCMPRRKK